MNTFFAKNGLAVVERIITKSGAKSNPALVTDIYMTTVFRISSTNCALSAVIFAIIYSVVYIVESGTQVVPNLVRTTLLYCLLFGASVSILMFFAKWSLYKRHVFNLRPEEYVIFKERVWPALNDFRSSFGFWPEEELAFVKVQKHLTKLARQAMKAEGYEWSIKHERYERLYRIADNCVNVYLKVDEIYRIAQSSRGLNPQTYHTGILKP